jgi:hypothetical protein
MADHADPYLRQLAIERAELDARAAELDKREAELHRAEAEIRAGREMIARDQDKLDHRESHYRAFLDQQSGKVVHLQRQASPSDKNSEQEMTAIKRRGRAALWRAEISKIVLRSDHGLANDEVKAELRKTALSSYLDTRRSTREYYLAVTKLQEKEVIIYHNSMAFSPEAFKRFQRDVEAGIVEDKRPIAQGHYSPMGEAIVELATRSGVGLRRYDLTAELNKDPMFAEPLAKHPSVFYNTVSHLIKRGRLEKIGDIYRIPARKLDKVAQ